MSAFPDHTSQASAFAVGSTSERLSEIAEILAAGLMRVMAAKSSGLSPDGGEYSLHFTADQSGHAKPSSLGKDA